MTPNADVVSWEDEMAKPVFKSRESGDKVMLFGVRDLPDSDLTVLMSCEDFSFMECYRLDEAGKMDH